MKEGEAERIAEKAYADAVLRSNGGEPIPRLADLFDEWALVRGLVASAAHSKSVGIVGRLPLCDLGELAISEPSTLRIEKPRNKHLVDHEPASANHWMRVLRLVVNWAVRRKSIATLP